MPLLGFEHQGKAWMVHDTCAQVPTSCSLSDACPNAGNVKPIATTIPRLNCFMISSREVQSRALGTQDQTHFFRFKLPAAGIPRCLCNSQSVGTLRWQLQ